MNETPTGSYQPTGELQEISEQRTAHARGRDVELEQYAIKSQTHYWLAIAHFSVGEASLDAFDGVEGGSQPVLDAENFLGTAVACLICEQAYQPILRRRRCPGEPK